MENEVSLINGVPLARPLETMNPCVIPPFPWILLVRLCMLSGWLYRSFSLLFRLLISSFFDNSDLKTYWLGEGHDHKISVSLSVKS